MSDQESKLHIDSDWKAEAQAEKERLAAEEAAVTSKGSGGREMPEASLRTLVEVLAAQAAMGLATMQDPETKGVMVDLEGARFSIDLLAVIQEKTKGNLTAEEQDELTQTLAGLRERWVQVRELVEKHGTVAAGAAGPDADPSADPTARGRGSIPGASPGVAPGAPGPGPGTIPGT